jgi:hypothetical protein
MGFYRNIEKYNKIALHTTPRISNGWLFGVLKFTLPSINCVPGQVIALNSARYSVNTTPGSAL